MRIRRGKVSQVADRWQHPGDAPSRWRVVLTLVVGVATMTPVGLLATTGVASAATCRPGIGQSIYASVGDSPVRVGTVIDYDVEISLTPDDCPISDGTVDLTWPDGTTVQTLATGVSLAPNTYEDFYEQALSLPEYTVAAADLNADDEVMATAVTNATAT